MYRKPVNVTVAQTWMSKIGKDILYFIGKTET